SAACGEENLARRRRLAVSVGRGGWGRGRAIGGWGGGGGVVAGNVLGRKAPPANGLGPRSSSGNPQSARDERLRRALAGPWSRRAPGSHRSRARHYGTPQPQAAPGASR